MEELRTCPTCNRELPHTPEFFYYYAKKNQWCSYCRKCDANRVNKRLMAKYVYKKRLPKYDRKQPVKILPATKLCKYCGNEYPITTEYWYYSETGNRFEVFKCIECRSEASRILHHKLSHDTNETGEYPGEFDTLEEKQEVHELLTLLEWKYSPTTGIWYKKGIKSMHNFWDFQKPEYDRNRKKNYDSERRIT